MAITALDTLVSEWFLARYGAGEVMRKVYDPGSGHVALRDLFGGHAWLPPSLEPPG
jgi:hypothetical protein